MGEDRKGVRESMMSTISASLLLAFLIAGGVFVLLLVVAGIILLTVLIKLMLEDMM